MCVRLSAFPADASLTSWLRNTPQALHSLCGDYNSVQILLLCQHTWLHKAEHSLVLVKRGRFGREGRICQLIPWSSLHKQTLEKSRPAVVEGLPHMCKHMPTERGRSLDHRQKHCSQWPSTLEGIERLIQSWPKGVKKVSVFKAAYYWKMWSIQGFGAEGSELCVCCWCATASDYSRGKICS